MGEMFRTNDGLISFFGIVGFSCHDNKKVGDKKKISDLDLRKL